jgi:hypothetical protein
MIMAIYKIPHLFFLFGLISPSLYPLPSREKGKKGEGLRLLLDAYEVFLQPS